MAERASMPTFVPRTVASFERAATVVARRVAAPVRMLATRALSFADRLMGSWAGAGPTTVVGLDGGVLPMPRPWYEVAADEDVIWPQQAATRAPDATPAADRGGANAAIAATVATEVASAAAERVTAAAERGAAIAKTNLTVLPEAAAREAARPVGTTNVAAPATPATTAAPSAQTGAASSTAATTSAATTNAGAASGGTQSSGATTTDATTADAIAAAAATPGARD